MCGTTKYLLEYVIILLYGLKYVLYLLFIASMLV